MNASTWLQLDLGVGVSLYGAHITGTRTGLWGGLGIASLLTAQARAFIGPSFVGVLAFQYGVYPYGVSRVSFTEINGDVGAGYRFQLSRFSLTPYGGLLLRYRDHSLVGGEGGIGGTVGLNVRLALASWFGLAVDLNVPLMGAGPDGFDAQGNVTSILDGIGFRGTVSLSLVF